jgi:hypothetical protein
MLDQATELGEYLVDPFHDRLCVLGEAESLCDLKLCIHFAERATGDVEKVKGVNREGWMVRG